MNNFNVISKKFFNEYRNGAAFGSNLSEFTDRLQGNKGGILQLLEVIEVGTIVNESETTDIQFFELPFASFAKFTAPLLDFEEEGLYLGAALLIEFDGTSVVGTCAGVTGTNNIDLQVDSATRTLLLAAGFENGDIREDIVIKVTSSPIFLTYKYGLTQNFVDAAPNYNSLYGGQQNYQLKGITGSFQTMTWVGNLEGSNLGTARIKFNTTVDDYKHQFTIEHTFKLPFFEQGEQTNLNGVLNPLNLLGSNSLRYNNGFFFGGLTNITVAQFEDIGGVGNVGYFDENFNGFVNNYTIENLLITNFGTSGTIEGTLVNIITFDIISSAGNWTAGVDEVIFTHSKLPTIDEYDSQTEDFDDIWLFENIRNVEGVAPVSNLGGILSDFEFDIDGGDPARLNVTVKVTFNTTRQLKVTNISEFLLYVTVAHNDLSDPDLVDRVNAIVKQGTYVSNLDVTGLITTFQPDIYEHWDFDSGTKFFTNFDGWDGDFLGIDFTFTTDVVQGAIVKDFKFKLVADDGTTIFQLLSIPIAITKIGTVTIDSKEFQLLNKDFPASFNMPVTDQLNQLELGAIIPSSPAPVVQTWNGKLGFRVSWRDWIQNLDVPESFIDFTKPNDNQNEKSSNYSGVSSFEIKAMIELVMGSDTGVDTTYLLLSDISSILDFDDAGGSSFSAVTNLFDANGDATSNLFTDQNVRIEIEFSHTLGTITLADIWGRIWIEPDQTTLQPFDLSTDKDLNDVNSPLQPTDTLSSGNTQFVEIISILNKVTLICQTNKNNIIDGLVYNVYGRLGTKI